MIDGWERKGRAKRLVIPRPVTAIIIILIPCCVQYGNIQATDPRCCRSSKPSLLVFFLQLAACFDLGKQEVDPVGDRASFVCFVRLG